MREIPLTRGYVTLVDDDDYEWLSQWKWYAANDRTNVYVQRAERLDNGKQRTIRMHRLILGVGKGIVVDHIDRDGLNNQRSNLRIATPQQNTWNRRKFRSNTSGFRGVAWDSSNQKWKAKININGKPTHLGLFDTPEEAAWMYDHAARIHYGEFASLNFPDEVAS